MSEIFDDTRASVNSFRRAYGEPEPVASITEVGADSIVEVQGGGKRRNLEAFAIRPLVNLAQLFTERRGKNPIRLIGIAPATLLWILASKHSPLRP